MSALTYIEFVPSCGENFVLRYWLVQKLTGLPGHSLTKALKNTFRYCIVSLLIKTVIVCVKLHWLI